MIRRIPPRKVRYFEPVAPRLARNTVIESTFEVGRRFRWVMLSVVRIVLRTRGWYEHRHGALSA